MGNYSLGASTLTDNVGSTIKQACCCVLLIFSSDWPKVSLPFCVDSKSHVLGLQGKMVVSVDCGYQHTVALTGKSITRSNLQLMEKCMCGDTGCFISLALVPKVVDIKQLKFRG